MIDLCRGPHVRHTGKIKTLKIHKVSGITLEALCRPTCLLKMSRLFKLAFISLCSHVSLADVSVDFFLVLSADCGHCVSLAGFCVFLFFFF